MQYKIGEIQKRTISKMLYELYINSDVIMDEKINEVVKVNPNVLFNILN